MATRAVSIWDWPVRITHWSFVVLIPALYFTAENKEMAWHMRLGHVLLALLIFRVVWGFVGTRTARFASFVRGPAAVLAYLRGGSDPKREVGHSPLAALAILALLGLMLMQVTMGLFAGDPFDGATGPLNSLVGVATADTLTETHEWFVYVIFGMIGLHLLAIAYYSAVRAQNLIGAMVVGKGERELDVEGNDSPTLGALLFSIGVALSITGWVWMGAPPLS